MQRVKFSSGFVIKIEMDGLKLKRTKGAIRAILILMVLFFGISVQKCDAKQITDNDFIKTQDKVLRNEYGTGSKIVLRGVNAGGWLQQELWMCPTKYSSVVQEQKTIENTLISRFGEQKTQELLDAYLDSFWTEADFDNCQKMGMNVIRLPFWYLNIVDESGNIKEDAFKRIDWFVEQAGERGIYVILDMHGAPGSQNDKDHSGDVNSNLGLWKGADVTYNQNLFVKVWKLIADHYKGNPIIAGYDLLNEPYCADGEYTSQQVWNLYNTTYSAIREIDKDHVIILEATWEPYNLPNPNDSRYGWKNVMYEYHSYNYSSIEDSDAQLSSVRRKINLINQAGYNVPSYIGETSFFSKMESWTKCLTELNNADLSWTIWNYKVTGDGTNTWGLYNMNIPSADIEQDDYDTIKSKWQASVTDANYINYELVQILDKFISYSPIKVKIGDAAVSSVANETYTGKGITPKITVKYGGKTLTENNDYTLTYSDNIECGKATITITGIGSYDGIKKVNFNILTEAVKNLKQSAQTAASATLKWKKSYNAEGYYIYQYKKGSYVKIAKLKLYYSSYRIRGLKAGTKYKFKICSYITIDGKEYTGKESYITSYTRVGTAKLKAKKTSKKIKLSWNKVKGAKGYEIYQSSAPKLKYTRIKSIASAKKKSYVYDVKKNGTYFVKIRAYSKINGKRTYGKFTKVIRMKVK